MRKQRYIRLGLIASLAITAIVLILPPLIRAQSPSFPFGEEAIFFVYGPSDDREVYTIEPDGSGIERLTDVKHQVRSFAVDLITQALVLAVDNGGGGGWQLRKVSFANPTADEAIPNTSGCVYPAATSDGLLTAMCGGITEKDVYLIDLQTGMGQRLTETENSKQNPEWDSEDEWLYFEQTEYGAGYVDIVRMSRDGSIIETVVANGTPNLSPAPHPTNGRILFVTGWFQSIRSVKPDGSDEQVVLNHSAQQVSWSPDGSQFLFRPRISPDKELYKVNSDGSGTVKLTPEGHKASSSVWINTPSTPLLTPTPEPTSTPSPSPTATPTPTTTATPSPTPTDSSSTTSVIGEVFIYFITGASGERDVYRIKPDGSGLEQLTFNGSVASFTVSPDGKQIIFAPGGLLRNLTVGETTSASIPSTSECVYPSFSPSGTEFAFICGGYLDQEIYIANTDGSNKRQVTSDQGQKQLGQWAGSWIYYARVIDPDNWDIFKVHVDTEEIIQLTTSSELDKTLALNPANDKIAFSQGYGRKLMTMNADGTGEERVFPYMYGMMPSYSPDGTQLVYGSWNPGQPRDLYIIDAEGSEPTLLFGNGYTNNWPVWIRHTDATATAEPTATSTPTPTSTPAPLPPARILYEVYKGGDNYDIHTARLDGADEIQLTNQSGMEVDASWSPRRDTVAYSIYDNSRGVWEIWLRDADGSNDRYLVDGLEPAFSPDGEKIAFTKHKFGTGGDLDIFIIELGSGNIHQITETDLNTNDRMASWSPDGHKLAFVAHVDPDIIPGGNPQLFTINLNGSGRTMLTADHPTKQSPSWSPDGNWIAFVSDGGVGGARDIHIINSDGSNRQNLTHHEASDVEPVWFPDGSKILFTSSRLDGFQHLYTMNPDGSNQQPLQIGNGDANRPDIPQNLIDVFPMPQHVSPSTPTPTPTLEPIQDGNWYILINDEGDTTSYGPYATNNEAEQDRQDFLAVAGDNFVASISASLQVSSQYQPVQTPSALDQLAEWYAGGSSTPLPTPTVYVGQVLGTQIGDSAKREILDRDLQYGAQGEDVRMLQAFLNEMFVNEDELNEDPIVINRNTDGYPGREITNFGPATQDGVERFQQAYIERGELDLLEPDGVVAGDTRSLINSLLLDDVDRLLRVNARMLTARKYEVYHSAAFTQEQDSNDPNHFPGSGFVLGSVQEGGAPEFDDNVLVTEYENGYIYYYPLYGPFVVRGAILATYLSWGGHTNIGDFGLPISDEYPAPGTGHMRQDFEGASIAYLPEIRGYDRVTSKLTLTPEREPKEGTTPLQRSAANRYNEIGGALEHLAKRFGITDASGNSNAAALLAVLEVETRRAFDEVTGEPIIRVENQWLFNLWVEEQGLETDDQSARKAELEKYFNDDWERRNGRIDQWFCPSGECDHPEDQTTNEAWKEQNWQMTNPSSQNERQAALQRAIAIFESAGIDDQDSAYGAISMGAPQIMGFNCCGIELANGEKYINVGYVTAQQMYYAFGGEFSGSTIYKERGSSEYYQYLAMLQYMRRAGLLNDLRQDSPTFSAIAQHYNGELPDEWGAPGKDCTDWGSLAYKERLQCTYEAAKEVIP